MQAIAPSTGWIDNEDRFYSWTAPAYPYPDFRILVGEGRCSLFFNSTYGKTLFSLLLIAEVKGVPRVLRV